VGSGDLQALLEARVAESQILEFKAALPGPKDEDKREFLADVSSFANTRGGVIGYGIEAERNADGQDSGIIAALPGLATSGLDAEKLRLSAMLRDGLSPPLTYQVEFAQVPAGPHRSVLLLGVSRSVVAPHMVTFRGLNRFYRRSESGKYQPDVMELRRMFLESASWVAQCDDLRRTRLNGLRSFPGLDMTSVCLVHVLPLGRLDSIVDLRTPESILRTALPPLRQYGWSSRFNADGFLLYTGDGTTVRSYTQWLRCGGAEGFSSSFVSRYDGGAGSVLLLYGRELGDAVGGICRKRWPGNGAAPRDGKALRCPANDGGDSWVRDRQ